MFGIASRYVKVRRKALASHIPFLICKARALLLARRSLETSPNSTPRQPTANRGRLFFLDYICHSICQFNQLYLIILYSSNFFLIFFNISGLVSTFENFPLNSPFLNSKKVGKCFNLYLCTKSFLSA